MSLENELIDKFMPLIKWASMKHAYRTGNYQQNFIRFYDEGIETFCVCLDKWKNKPQWKKKFVTEKGRIEFEKYFKAAMFTNMMQVQMEIFAKNKKVFFISLDDLLNESDKSNTKRHGLLAKLQSIHRKFGIDKSQMVQSLSDEGGFDSVRYEELLQRVESYLKGLDLIIFRILVKPPKELRLMILRENARKMRHFDIHHVKPKGINSVRMTKNHILKYLNSNGNHVSISDFNRSIKKVKDTVLEICGE